ncbi:general odorant-binding protein 67 [Topomyia yanbarensis]|uniref:general odorant-binding protein 67 n=1 Tax=Topomyia yanbarensis TaxID=2498891 RepID=UPI00273B1305|nr:general odorant-binding protein 67 [Topomyia yanbarensis]
MSTMKNCLIFLTVISFIALSIAQDQCHPPPNQKNPKECCNVPTVMPSRDQFITCIQKFPPPPPPAPGSPPPAPGTPPPGANCIAECVLAQLGMVSNGAISKDAATATLVAALGSSAEWQALAKTTVDACYSKVSSLLTQKDSSGCNAGAEPFMECLPTTMFKNCPTSSWAAIAECEQQKAHLAKGCPIMSLMGPPHLM